MEQEEYNHKFNCLKCCVIIPTYNNCLTLKQVIDEVHAFTGNIIIINDGSTDTTGEILTKIEDIEIINFPKNRGKGHAIRAGFLKAIEKGYQYAITIDSDGQHKPEEVTKFIDEIEKEPDALIVGVREFTQKNLPRKNSFANKFSNFWFRLYTGNKLLDTQSGFRLYPLDFIKRMKLFTGKYEFELEILVRLAWKNVKIISIPINVFYPPAENRISHFRPFRDFFRISMLNTAFFFITFFYVKPVYFLKKLNKKSLIDFYKKNIIATGDSDRKIVLSVMFGIFMGIIPIWGYQLIAAIALSHLFRLNKVIVIVAANISITPMLPIILYLSYVTGAYILNINSGSMSDITNITFAFIKNNLFQYIIGSIVFAFLSSIFFGLVVFIMLKLFRKQGKSK